MTNYNATGEPKAQDARLGSQGDQGSPGGGGAARLSQQANEEVGRLLNGKNNSQASAIGHLASAAGRAAESLLYLADLDDRRFAGDWLDDGHPHDAVDDGHVRWGATGALTSLDLCIAAAARLAGFAKRPPRGEDSIRDYYRVEISGTVVDKRDLVKPPWRVWIDAVVCDPRYDKLLRIRNALVHADALRIIHGTTGPIAGHSLRYGYNVGPLKGPAQPSSHLKVMAREIVELSRDVSVEHVRAFIAVLSSHP